MVGILDVLLGGKLDFDLQLHGTRPNRKKYFSLLSNEGLHCNDIMGNQFQIINP